MVGADGSNGKDGIFCGKEKMQMSVYYSIGSILLGLAAWWIPYAARGKVRNFGGLSKYVFLSFCCCVAALFLQFLEIRYRVHHLAWLAPCGEEIDQDKLAAFAIVFVSFILSVIFKCLYFSFFYFLL